MIIFKHTFKRMLTLKFLIIYFIIFIPILFLLTYSFNLTSSYRGLDSTNMVLDASIANFFVINFMWIIGVPFLITTASRGSSLIQKEIDDETLVLLVSKPITRSRIYLEKWLASFAISLLIGLLSIFIAFTFYVLYFKMDDLILTQLFGMVPGLIVYIIFVNLIFTSLAMVITSLFRHRIRAIIFLIILIMAMEFIFPALKQALFVSGAYEKYHLYLLDLNYHFGVMYYKIITVFSSIEFTSAAQNQINQFVYIFGTDRVYGSSSDRDFNFTIANNMLLSYMKPGIIFTIWTFIIGFNLYISHFLLKQKDID